MPITGNKGEWSEVYVLLKLLGDGEVHAGDENLNKIKNLVYPIIMILREEAEGKLKYLPENSDVVIQTSDGTELLRLPAKEFESQAMTLLGTLANFRGIM